MVYDEAGGIRLIDWTKQGRPTVLFLFEPRAFAATLGGKEPAVAGGTADWLDADQSVLGAVRGSRWAVWDTRSTAGGGPAMTGEAWTGSAQGNYFRCALPCSRSVVLLRRALPRWCPTDQRLFALASSSPEASSQGNAVHVYRTSFPQCWLIVAPFVLAAG